MEPSNSFRKDDSGRSEPPPNDPAEPLFDPGEDSLRDRQAAGPPDDDWLDCFSADEEGPLPEEGDFYLDEPDGWDDE